MRLYSIYSWTIPLLFHNMFSHAVYKYMVRRSIQSVSVDFTRNHALPVLQVKLQDTTQDFMRHANNSSQTGPSFIGSPPPCRTCKHFKPVIFKGEFEIGKYYGTCRLFTVHDPMTHIYGPLFSHEARRSESYCGKEGRYHSLHSVLRK